MRLQTPFTRNARINTIKSEQSSVLVLANLFNPKEVDLAAEPDFYTEIAEDVQSGCEDHGVVLSAHVDRESIQGRVLVRFASAESAVAAQRAMNGRLFAGKSVQASFMHEGAFEEFVKRQEGQT